MKTSQRAQTFLKVLTIGAICFFVLVVLGMLLPAFARSRENARISQCKANLQEVGKAIAAYREDNSGYFPFSWQRAGEAEPDGNGAANGAMAATSLGNLYPRYVLNPKLFHCPSTEDQPSFVLNLPLEYRAAGQTGVFVGALPQGSNWTLKSNQPASVTSAVIGASSYGYDPRISPREPGGHVVAADWDGTWENGHDTCIQNHEGGQDVLFVDGSVRWIQGDRRSANFCSNVPFDNIFAEDNWDADRDSFLVDTDAALSSSFDSYKHLHYPPQDRRASPQKSDR